MGDVASGSILLVNGEGVVISGFVNDREFHHLQHRKLDLGHVLCARDGHRDTIR